MKDVISTTGVNQFFFPTVPWKSLCSFLAKMISSEVWQRERESERAREWESERAREQKRERARARAQERERESEIARAKERERESESRRESKSESKSKSKSERVRAREPESQREGQRARERARERERESATLFPSCQVIAKSMLFLIMTFHAISAAFTSKSCLFCHFCHFPRSADGRDIVLIMEKDDEKVRCVRLSRHQSIRFAWERVSPLFCSFE